MTGIPLPALAVHGPDPNETANAFAQAIRLRQAALAQQQSAALDAQRNAIFQQDANTQAAAQQFKQQQAQQQQTVGSKIGELIGQATDPQGNTDQAKLKNLFIQNGIGQLYPEVQSSLTAITAANQKINAGTIKNSQDALAYGQALAAHAAAMPHNALTQQWLIGKINQQDPQQAQILAQAFQADPDGTWARISANAAPKPITLSAGQQLVQPDASGKYQTVAQGGPSMNVSEQEMQDWLAKNPGKGPADFMAYKATLVPQMNFNLQSGMGGMPSYKQLPPQEQAQVQAIIDGRQRIPSSFAQKMPYWQRIMAAAYQLDPQLNEQRYELRKSYTVGPQSKEINAINTTLGHVGALAQAVQALNNGNVMQLNRIANAYGVQVGQTPITTFRTIVNRVGPELVKAYSGGAGSEAEREEVQNDFNPSLSPQQLLSNARETAKLLRSKISALENQWDTNKSTGTPSFDQQFIMPQARQALQMLAPSAGGSPGNFISLTAPGGKVYHFPTQAAADNFKKLAGIK